MTAVSPDTQPNAVEVARLFHETYECLAPEHGYRTREASAVPWEEVPESNRMLMVETVAVVLADLRARGLLLPEPAEQEWRVLITTATKPARLVWLLPMTESEARSELPKLRERGAREAWIEARRVGPWERVQ